MKVCSQSSRACPWEGQSFLPNQSELENVEAAAVENEPLLSTSLHSELTNNSSLHKFLLTKSLYYNII